MGVMIEGVGLSGPGHSPATDPDSVGTKLIAERVFGGRLDDRAHAVAVYEKNTADVKAAFDEGRLLKHVL